MGSVGSIEYNAVKDILQRMDADVVAFQELKTADRPNWETMAAQLGYGNTPFRIDGPMTGPLYVGYFSRFPILSTYNVLSPQTCPGETVKEITRPPFRAVIDGDWMPRSRWCFGLCITRQLQEPDDPFRTGHRGVFGAPRTSTAYLAANPDP